MSKPGMWVNILQDKYKVESKLKYLTGAFLCDENTEEEKKKTGLNNKYTVSITTMTGDDKSHCAFISNLETHLQIISESTLSSEDLAILINFTGLLCVRCKGDNYQKYCMGLFDDNSRNTIIQQSYMDYIFNLWTAKETQFCTRVNIWLGLDYNLDKIDKTNKLQYSEYIRELKCCIGWQKPKHSGLVYRGLSLSCLEIYTYKFKKIFYFPTFLSTSTNKEVATQSPFKGNVLLIIDTSSYNNFTTLIQDKQTKYPEENECLISCYNIFELIDISYNGIFTKDPYVTIKLKIINYDKNNDITKHNIIGSQHSNFPTGFLKSGSGILVNKNFSAQELFNYYQDMLKLHPC